MHPLEDRSFRFSVDEFGISVYGVFDGFGGSQVINEISQNANRVSDGTGSGDKRFSGFIQNSLQNERNYTYKIVKSNDAKEEMNLTQEVSEILENEDLQTEDNRCSNSVNSLDKEIVPTERVSMQFDVTQSRKQTIKQNQMQQQRGIATESQLDNIEMTSS